MKMKLGKGIIASALVLPLGSLNNVQAAQLQPVQNVKLRRFSSQTIKVSWKAVKSAKYYHVYYQSGDDQYKLGRTTKKTYGLITKLKNNTNYKVYVTAGMSKKASESDSQPSEIKSMKTKDYRRTIVIAGDSVVEDLNIFKKTTTNMHSSANVKIVGIVAVNSKTFRTKKNSKGMTGIDRVKAAHPYRVYFMLGLNEIHFRPWKDIFNDRKILINQLRKQNPDVDIVWCATEPVAKSEMKREPKMRYAPQFNKQLEKFAKKNHCQYWDYTGFLKDQHGYLKQKYATPDGYHWQRNTCEEFGTHIGKFDKTLDD